MPLVLIDLDGTLLEGPSSEWLFTGHLARTGMLGPRQLAAFLSFAARHFRRFHRHVWKKDKAYLAGLPTGIVEEAAQEFVEGHLLARLRPTLLTRLHGHAQEGDTLALLTGTPDFLARPLAARLDIPYVAATVCDRSRGRFTSRPPHQHPFRQDKLAAAEKLCRVLQVPLGSCTAYADSVHDRFLMERVGNPVAVQPDHGLRAQAMKMKWKIV